jgi:opacity protein-like surface antigen
MRAPRLSLAALLLAGVSTTASAQTAGHWQLEVTPYLWGAGMKGDVQAPNLPRTNVDMSFVDILHNLDFGIMGAFEARKDRWGFLFDGIYMKVSDAASSTQGPLTVSADATIQQQVLAGAVAYRVSDGPALVDVLAGARYSKIKVKAVIDASLFGLAGRTERTGDKSWTDPYLGIRVQAPIDERWTLVGYADVGGGGGADSTWQAAIGAQYAYSKDVAIKFGYRYLSVDYNKNGFLYDIDSAGLYLGAGFRF